MKFPKDYETSTNCSLFKIVKCFSVPFKENVLFIIAGENERGWEHVSVSSENRCPTWEEMCYIKDMFWEEEECVIQFHPPRSEYVNIHPYCLHLWRPIEVKIPSPTNYAK